MHYPIQVVHLFAELDALLINCLSTCKTEDWQRPTLAREWTVKDVAAHLLDGNIRALSIGRDQYFGHPIPPDSSYEEVVRALNELNAQWILAAKRLSPSLLIQLLESTGNATTAYYKTLNLGSPAPFPVAWAGEEQSLNWFHIAREYTERWHHQAQIRAAIGNLSPLLTPRLYHPFLQTTIRGMPHLYRNVPADTGTVVQINIAGPSGGTWSIKKMAEKWTLTERLAESPAAVVSIEQSIAWKLFTKAMRPTGELLEQKTLVSFTGNQGLAEPALSLIAVMA